jgi:hypothetical protein
MLHVKEAEEADLTIEAYNNGLIAEASKALDRMSPERMRQVIVLMKSLSGALDDAIELAAGDSAFCSIYDHYRLHPDYEAAFPDEYGDARTECEYAVDGADHAWREPDGEEAESRES